MSKLYRHRHVDAGVNGTRAIYPLIAGLALSLVWSVNAGAEDDPGNLSANPYAPDSTSNPFGAGSPYKPDGINNEFGKYGSPYSDESVNNPHASNPPELYDQEGNYRGKLSSNPYDPDSTSNPYGRYGSPSSPDSVNNPYGAGNPYDAGSPTNPYGEGWEIRVGDELSDED